ncbi:MAG: hypothetical protein L0215_16355 [Gemmataceae bacterium]|nr:hypothetical protein [Gemmataceae bacterium]
MFSRLVATIASLFVDPRSKDAQSRQRVRPGFRPVVEILEDRAVPAVFTVNTSADTPDVMLDGFALDVQGNTSLRAAIEEGNASADNNVTINFLIAAPDGGGPLGYSISLETPLPALENNFTIDGLSPQTLAVMRKPTAPFFRVFEIAAGNAVSINRLTISRGVEQFGGGIRNLGSLNLFDVVLHNNYALQSGGAISNQGTLIIEDCSLDNNQGDDHGGAIANVSGQAWIHSSQIYENNSNGWGGGVYNAAQLTIDTGTSIHSNRARFGLGGGIFNVGQLTMSDATLRDNRADNWGGGLYSDGTATLTNVSITGNRAFPPDGGPGKGGGVYVKGGTTRLIDCTLSNNTCGTAGGGNGAYIELGGALDIINWAGIIDQIVNENPS